MKLLVSLAVLAGLLVATQAYNYVLETGDVLNYEKWYAFSGRIDIRVRAGHDVHILLARQEATFGDSYEIVIGADYNYLTLLRKNNAESPNVFEVTKDIVSADIFNGFWIRLVKGKVLVGRKGEYTAFLTYHDDQAPIINTFSVSTGFGAVGSWVISTSEDFAGEPQWKETTSQFLETSTLSESDEKVNLNMIVRVLKEDALVPGYIDAKTNKAVTVWEGVTAYSDSFEVLDAYYGEWVQVINGKVGDDAFSGGYTHAGEPLFVGRIMINDVMTIGYVQNGKLHVAYNDVEYKFVNFEIFM